MEQHAVPQQISSYQFRLVGDMTLKQFLRLAGGALVALLFYASGLPALIRWPLIVFFVALGAALAFLPIQGRPFEQWVLAFFRSIYSPTLFYWQVPQAAPVYFQEEGAAVLPQGTKPTMGFISQLEDAEKAFINKMTQFFGAPAPATSQPVQPLTPLTSQPQGQIYTSPPQPKKDLKIPGNVPTQIAPQGFKPQMVVEEQKKEAPGVPIATQSVTQILKGQTAPLPAYAAQFSLGAAPPAPPMTVNTITGQVMDETGKIVEGAILEVQDEAGRPVRALKTNKAGHFLVVTPLASGNYKIVIEKEGYVFDPLSFTAKDEMIAPIAIRARQKIVS